MTGVGTWKWAPDASWDVALFSEVWSVSRGICNRPDGNDLVDNREANRQITWIIHLSIKSIEFPPSSCFILFDVSLILVRGPIDGVYQSWIFIWTGYLRVTGFDYFLFRSTVSCDMFLLLVVLLFNDRLIFNYSTFRVTIVQFYNFRGFFTSTRDFLFQYISWKAIEVSLATMFMEHWANLRMM